MFSSGARGNRLIHHEGSSVEPGAFAWRLSQPSPGRHLFSGGRTCLPLSHMPNTNHEYPRHTSSGDGRSLLPIWLEVDSEMHSEVEVEA